MAQRQTSGTHFPPGEALPVGYPLRGVREDWGWGVKVYARWGMVAMGLGWGEGLLQTNYEGRQMFFFVLNKKLTPEHGIKSRS